MWFVCLGRYSFGEKDGKMASSFVYCPDRESAFPPPLPPTLPVVYGVLYPINRTLSGLVTCNIFLMPR